MKAQVSFASDRGVKISLGDPLLEKPGKTIIFPSSGALLKHKTLPLNQLRTSYLKHFSEKELNQKDITYLATELNTTIEHISILLEEINESKK